MIIRMTVNDNDFTNMLEAFAEKLVNRLLSPDVPKGMDAWEYHKQWKKVLELLNPNITEAEDMSIEDKLFMKDIIKMHWDNYVNKCIRDEDDEPDTKEYLKDNFEVCIWSSMHDRWENSEAVYYFTTNQKFITQ